MLLLNNIYEVAIIGGGASGLMCAVELLSSNDHRFSNSIILEKNDRVGKKLIATGNGLGNLTNVNLTANRYHGDPQFIKSFLEHEKGINLVSYLYNLGIPLTTDSNGKMYPLSRQASAVLDILRAYISNGGIDTVTNFNVTKIEKNNGIFTVYSGTEKVLAKNVVFAVGGASGKQFGTDGTSYSVVENLGHTRTKIYPSLVQLKTELKDIKGLKGLKEQVKVSAYDGTKKLAESTGEILFTEYGVSGMVIFDLSGYLTSVLNPNIVIEFLPQFNEEQTLSLIQDKISNSKFLDKNDILCGIINKRIGQAILKTANSNTAYDIVKALKSFRLKVLGNLGFNYSQVTKGGLKTDFINPNTFESKITKGLYLVGEVIDIDGDCGGFNLTFAFISGIVSARAIKA